MWVIHKPFISSFLACDVRKARDLRKIDSRVPNLVPTILIRKQAILVSILLRLIFWISLNVSQVNILHIRALIKADTVVLFDSYDSADSRLHSVYLYHLEVVSIFYDRIFAQLLFAAQSKAQGLRTTL